MKQAIDLFLDHFDKLEDKRAQSKILHSVREILLVTLCGVISGADGWEDIEIYGEAKLELLQKILPFANGIPSDETLRRLFRALNTEVFREVFVGFVSELFPAACAGLIAMDGKTSRRSHDGARKALHGVSAFATEARWVLAQVATAEKSNEITAIPEVLQLLDWRGTTVSIEAMGCQREIARQIIEGGGDYLLGLKGNQATLHDDVTWFFEDHHKVSMVLYFMKNMTKGMGASSIANVRRQVLWIGCRKSITGKVCAALYASPRRAASRKKPQRRQDILSALCRQIRN